MKATRFLKKKYTKVLLRFGRVRAARTPDEKKKRFEGLARRLMGLIVVERELLYPICKNHRDRTPRFTLLSGSIDEMQRSLLGAKDALAQERFSHELIGLRKNVVSHRKRLVRVLSLVKKWFRRKQLVNVGAKMKARFREIKATEGWERLQEKVAESTEDVPKSGVRKVRTPRSGRTRRVAS